MRIILGLLVFFSIQWVAAAEPKSITSEIEQLVAGLYSFRYGSDRTLILIGEKGVAVTDPINPTAAGVLQKKIASLTAVPVTDIVYTNSFFNRVAGAEIFKQRGANITAQQQCAENLQQTPRADIVPVDISYDSQHSIDVGDASLELYYFGQSYGTCLSVIIAKPANIMMIFGLVNSDAAAVPTDPTLANYYLHNLLPFFDQLESLARSENIQYITGSYARLQADGRYAKALGPVSLITDQKLFWQQLLGAVKADYDNRIPARAMGNRLEMDKFSGFADFDEQRLKIMTRRVYSLYRIGR